MTKLSEAQLRAMAKYNREKTKSYTVKFFPKDMALYAYLREQPNKMGYLKELIRQDMKSKGLNTEASEEKSDNNN